MTGINDITVSLFVTITQVFVTLFKIYSYPDIPIKTTKEVMTLAKNKSMF